ncbi:hypothetical protein HU200_033346 [Digitaria exilis]|uniref:Uncharacterized protein n=1 Tax=Digitaria exilis TaxID=1010633 RepID=A0A835BMV9_9POAL|nr:hypothetical protein HU200_033346 [Digitaria exilis]
MEPQQLGHSAPLRRRKLAIPRNLLEPRVGASMAANGAAAAPPQAPAPPARRGEGVAAPRGLELAADAVLCCFMVALLVCKATSAAFMAARRVCGRHSGAAAVAEELFVKTLKALVLLLLFTLFSQRLLVHLRGRKEDREVPVSDFIIGPGRGRQGALHGYVTAHVLFVSFMSMMVGILLFTLAPAKESYTARVGYMVGDTGCFFYCVTFCIGLYQKLLVKLRSTYAKLKEA